MAESYQDIMSRLSGTQQIEKPKEANDFASYVRTLLENPNPRGSMFARQDEIDRVNQANLSNELEKKEVEEELKKIIKEASTGMFGGASGGYDSPNTGQGPLGVGKATDAIQAQALQDALMGFATGGLPGAIQSGLQSLATGGLGFLGSVNASQDPLQAWAITQGYAPVEVVDLSTPYGGGGGGMMGATTSPVNNAPLGPAVDLGTLDNPTPAAVNLGIGSSSFGGYGGVGGSGVSPGGGNAAGGFGFGGW